MKVLTLVISYVIIFTVSSSAQKNDWDVKPGEEVKDAVPPDVRFRYPNFVTGDVYFKDGKSSQASLNFNLLNEEMQFIDPRGDTLSIDDEVTIKHIVINSDSFYYSKGYLELVSSNAVVKLAKKQRLRIGDIKKIGGYGQPSSTSAITSVSSIYNRAGVTALKQRAELLLVKESIYYLGDNYNRFYLANKRNLMKMFGNKEAVIESFLNENRIRFNNEDDLKLLINFLQTL